MEAGTAECLLAKAGTGAISKLLRATREPQAKVTESLQNQVHETDNGESTLSLLIIGYLIVASLIAGGIIPLVIAGKVKVSTLRILSLFLGLFAITHGLYHLAAIQRLGFLADVVFEPVSVTLLFFFGLYYSRKAVP